MNKRQYKKNLKRLRIWIYACICLDYRIPIDIAIIDPTMRKQVNKLLRKRSRK